MIDLKEGGYLYLGHEGSIAVMREINALQRAEGADIALLDADALRARFPWLEPGEDVVIGSLGLSGEGWFDGWALLQAFSPQGAIARRGISHRGGRSRRNRRRAASSGVRLADGARIACWQPRQLRRLGRARACGDGRDRSARACAPALCLQLHLQGRYPPTAP